MAVSTIDAEPTPVVLSDHIAELSAQLQHDIDSPDRKLVLGEIRAMRRSLATLEEELMDTMLWSHGDAC